jgi:hypothetical protein
VRLKKQDTDVEISSREIGPMKDDQKRAAIFKNNVHQAWSCETIDAFTEEQDTDFEPFA